MRYINILLTALVLIPTAGRCEEWALVVNGDEPSSCTSRAHQRNVEVAVDTLLELGFARENVLVLAHAHEDEEHSTWRKPTRSKLRQALDELARRVQPGDKLIVYLTGHGDRFLGRSHLVLGSTLVSARWLARELGELHYGELIIISDQCFSGGMDDDFAALPRSVFVSSTSADQKASCVAFIRPFWRALTDARHDDDGDGYVSVEEAFLVARARAADRAVPTRPSDPIYRGLGGVTLAQATGERPTVIATQPLATTTTIAALDRVALVAADAATAGGI